MLTPTDPLWLAIPRAMELAALHLPDPEPALIAALSGGDVKAREIGNVMGDRIEPRDIPPHDFRGLETLTPSLADVHASNVPAIMDWVHRAQQRPHAPDIPAFGQVARSHAALYALHCGLVFVNRDDLVAWVSRFAAPEAPIKPPKKDGRNPRGLDYRAADAKLVAEMHHGIQAGKYPHRTDAARDLAPKAKGGGQEESKVARLIKAYGQHYGPA